MKYYSGDIIITVEKHKSYIYGIAIFAWFVYESEGKLYRTNQCGFTSTNLKRFQGKKVKSIKTEMSIREAQDYLKDILKASI